MGTTFSIRDPALAVECDFAGAATDRAASAAIGAAAEALHALDNYTPRPEPIRAAISTPHDKGVNVACALALAANVASISGWFDLSSLVAKEVERLSGILADTAAPPAPPAIVSDPSSTTALAKLLHFCWKFDQGKLGKPGVQNDFAGYRRVVGKVPAESVTVGEAETSTISMWLADMAPFTTNSASGVSTAPRRAVLAAMISCCCGMVTLSGRRQRNFVNEEESEAQANSQPAVGSVAWLLEVMVACIVFYDRAHHSGSVFTARDVPIKKCIACIRKHGGTPKSESRRRLLSSIQYSTLHFSTASSSIQSSVEFD